MQYAWFLPINKTNLIWIEYILVNVPNNDRYSSSSSEEGYQQIYSQQSAEFTHCATDHGVSLQKNDISRLHFIIFNFHVSLNVPQVSSDPQRY